MSTEQPLNKLRSDACRERETQQANSVKQDTDTDTQTHARPHPHARHHVLSFSLALEEGQELTVPLVCLRCERGAAEQRRQ
jgi:hypothetical protein